MGLKFEFPEGATPLDPDDAAGLLPGHISTQGQLNEWEYANVARGEAWAFRIRRRDILTTEFLQLLHARMFVSVRSGRIDFFGLCGQSIHDISVQVDPPG